MTKLHCYHTAVKLVKSRASLLFVLVCVLCLPMQNPTSAANGSKSFSAAPKIVRAAFQGGDGGGSNSKTCSGNSCYHEVLVCTNGRKQDIPNDPCCMKCCNDAGVCVTACCTPTEDDKGPGDILP
jgi:hypothetical protein